ncbi:MAG: hypothetical protein SGPRY_007576 [Prymnesium sp.]
MSVSSCAPPTDRMPHLPAAGITGEDSADTTEMTMKPQLYDQPPPTPPSIARWRKDMQPGKVCLHPGIAEDRDHERISTYGRAEPVGVKVHEVLNVAPKSYLMEKAIEKKESIYQSHQREPLGKAYVRGHELPQNVREAGFGRPTPQDVAGDETKELMHPTERIVPKEEHALYIKSHANYAPGEQRRRGYTWKGSNGEIDPTHHRFGMSLKGEVDGAGKALNPALSDDYKRPSIVVGKTLEDFRE